MKRLIFVISMLWLFMAAPATAANNPDVEFNAIKVEFDQPAIIIENRTMVPVRKIFELLGATVEWDNDTRTAKADLNGKKVEITIDKNEIIVDGKAEAIDAPARIINNRTLVPLRAVSQSYDCTVSWDNDTRTASVFSPWYTENERLQYSDDFFSFGYFADVKLIKTESGVSLKSNACSATFTTEDSEKITVNEEYIEDIKRGIDNFPGLTLLDIKKTDGKNAVEFSCYNKERTIYYFYAYKNGKAYNVAVTMPVGAERTDAERLVYSAKDFLNNW